MGTISFLIVLSFLVFFHELGHFTAARFFGVKINVFSIGFGRAIFTKYINGVRWQIALIPLGGYVQMKGQDDSNPNLKEDGKDAYNNKPAWQRIIILFAGPFANFLLAAILYFIVSLNGITTYAPQIGEIQKNSPAFFAGLEKNDTILSIDNKETRSWNDIGRIIIKSDQTLKFKISRNNKIITKNINPYMHDSKNIFKENIKKKMIGILPSGKIIKLENNLFQSLDYAYSQTKYASMLIFKGFQKLITGVIPSSEVGGVISIGKVISDASESSIISLLLITALISVNLGVLNLLPIPALDGGHIMFNLYELIVRKKPNDKIFLYLTFLGWIILGSLMLLGIYNDINRIFLNN